jgi:hypothetical protein
MSKTITILALLLTSCGIREEREPIVPENNLVGSWQHVYDTTGLASCDPNTDCKCSDFFNFYSSHAFDRSLQCAYKKGSYEIVNKKLRLIYVGEYPQVYEYSISQKELILIKDNTEHSYIRKPFRVRMETGVK